MYVKNNKKTYFEKYFGNFQLINLYYDFALN